MELVWLSVTILEIPDFIRSGGARRSERRLALEKAARTKKEGRGQGRGTQRWGGQKGEGWWGRREGLNGSTGMAGLPVQQTVYTGDTKHTGVPPEQHQTPANGTTVHVNVQYMTQRTH